MRKQLLKTEVLAWPGIFRQQAPLNPVLKPFTANNRTALLVQVVVTHKATVANVRPNSQRYYEHK